MRLIRSSLTVLVGLLLLAALFAGAGRAEDALSVGAALPKSLYPGQPVTLTGTGLKADQIHVKFCPYAKPADTAATCKGDEAEYGLCPAGACDAGTQSNLPLLDATATDIVFATPSGLLPQDYGLFVKSAAAGSFAPLAKIAVINRSGSDNLSFCLPYIISVGLVAVIAGLIAALAGLLKHTTPGSAPDWQTRLLLEPANNTYSLSKLQFYVWTAVGAAAYLYLASSKAIVQGLWAWPDIPGSLPVVFLGSAATAVAASGVSGLNGGKGSGDQAPSWSDLITSGGVVAPERVQFLVWTILGALGFLFYTFVSHLPTTIQVLPDIPDGFKYLMGASSLGYVGGKLARGPGPQIRDGSLQRTGGKIDVTVTGSALGTDGATYSMAVNDETAETIAAEDLDRGASSIDADSKLATRLVFHLPETGSLAPTPTDLSQRRLALTVVNSDGEKAVWNFTETGPVLETVSGVQSAGANAAPGQLVVTLKGHDIATAGARWFLRDVAAAGAQDVAVPPAAVGQPAAGAQTGEAVTLTLTIPDVPPITFIAPATSPNRRFRLRVVNPDGLSGAREFVA